MLIIPESNLWKHALNNGSILLTNTTSSCAWPLAVSLARSYYRSLQFEASIAVKYYALSICKLVTNFEAVCQSSRITAAHNWEENKLMLLIYAMNVDLDKGSPTDHV